MIIGITGLVIDAQGRRGSAGAGKSTVADRLVERHSFCSVGFADVMKRFVMELFDWKPEQVFGSTEDKNVPDKRYLQRKRNPNLLTDIEDAHFLAHLEQAASGRTYSKEELKQAEEENMRVYLTPRLALQKLGSEWGRSCYPDIWALYAMRVAKKLLKSEGQLYYTSQHGLSRIWASDDADRMIHGPKPLKAPAGVCFSDVRFKNELAVIKREGGKVIRVVRPVEKLFIDNAHDSENDLNDVPDEEFDYVIMGKPKDVPDLQLQTDRMRDVLTGRIMPYDQSQEDVPPFMRK